ARSGFGTGPGNVVFPDFFPLEGKRVAMTNTAEKEVQVWDEKTGQELPRWTIPHLPQLVKGVGTSLRIYISPNARYAVAARQQAPSAKVEPIPLHVIDLEKKQLVAELSWAGGQVHFTADSAHVLVADHQGRCSWVKLSSGAIDREWALPPGSGGRY